MANPNFRLPDAPALPPTVEDFRALRKTEATRTLNDIVEEVHLALYNDEKYQRFLYAVYDSQAVEGSLAADNFMAASLIREKAKATGRSELSRQNLQTINLCLGVVLRRYGQSRKDRRDMIGGELVPSDNGK